MTESNTEAPTPDAPSTTAPAPTPTSAPAEGKRYAAYDKTFLRFVGGGSHDTRKAAVQAAKDRKVKSFEVREV